MQQFLDKTDGRDKLLATVQYAAMFISAGQAGDVKKIQASVAAARKVFRIMRVRSGCPWGWAPAPNCSPRGGGGVSTAPSPARGRRTPWDFVF